MIILSTHYGKLPPFTTVLPPQKHTGIGPGVPGSISWVADLEVLGAGSWVLSLKCCVLGRESQVLSQGSRVLDPGFQVFFLDYAN